MTEHTKLTVRRDGAGDRCICSPTRLIASFVSMLPPEMEETYANELVKRYNMHDELVVLAGHFEHFIMDIKEHGYEVEQQAAATLLLYLLRALLKRCEEKKSGN